jgi:hypothetical protein
VQGSTPPHIGQFITHLHAVGQHQHALAALLEAAGFLPPGEFARIAEALDASSAHHRTLALLDEAVRTSSPADVAHLIRALDESGQEARALYVMWNSIQDRPSGHAGSVLDYLNGAGSRLLDDAVLRTLWRSRPPTPVAQLAVALDNSLPHKADLVCGIDDRSVTDVAALVAALEALSAGTLSNRVLKDVVSAWDHQRQARLVITLEERSLSGCAQFLEQRAGHARPFVEELAGLRSAQQESAWQLLTSWPRDLWRNRRSRTHREPSAHDHALYVVKPEDSLLGIADRFGVRWAGIAEANSLSAPFALSAGQELRIPFQTDGSRFVPPPFPRKLVPGHVHPVVRQLQTALKQAGYLDAAVEFNDRYGELTCEAVARFNQEHRLSRPPADTPDPVISHRGWDLLHRIARGKHHEPAVYGTQPDDPPGLTPLP